jgi:uncharacterized membrane protein
MSRRHPPVRTSVPTGPAAGTKPIATRARIPGIDALRGGALCLMFVYHFAFDLRFYRVLAADFEHDPFWLGFRTLIVTSFLLLVGVSLVLADRAGARASHFWKRIVVIAACALAATIASWWLFPQTFITFGILHAIAVASILAWPCVRRPALALAIGVAVIAGAYAFNAPLFDSRAWSWVGFTTHKPATEDYVPLFPWAGVVFVGVALGHVLIRTSIPPLTRLARAPAWLTFLGRHSLFVYMVHQPILLGALWLFVGR